MGDIGLAIGGRNSDSDHAVNALINAADAYAGELELVTLGPLTNVALALSLAPRIASQIKRCFIMGGTSDNRGNVTPVSEFNMWVDPEAAQIVFSSSLEKVMVGWDISRKYAVLNDDEAKELVIISSEFVLKDLPIINIDNKKCIGYNMHSKNCCYNASLYGALILSYANRIR